MDQSYDAMQTTLLDTSASKIKLCFKPDLRE